MAEPASQPRLHRWHDIARKLLPRAVLLVGIALVLLHTFRSRPSAVEVAYDYGGARRGLVTAHVVYRQGGEICYQVKFDYRQQPAAAIQHHALRLVDGDYQVEIALTYAAAPPAGLQGQHTRTAGGATVVTLERPLVVRGAGELRVFLAPPREG